MKSKRYWVKGAGISFVVGLFIATTTIVGPLLPSFFYKVDFVYLITRSAENINFLTLIVSYTVYGAILGFLFGKLKNKGK